MVESVITCEISKSLSVTVSQWPIKSAFVSTDVRFLAQADKSTTVRQTVTNTQEKRQLDRRMFFGWGLCKLAFEPGLSDFCQQLLGGILTWK
jgi:hypothetical protein